MELKLINVNTAEEMYEKQLKIFLWILRYFAAAVADFKGKSCNLNKIKKKL